LSIQNFFAMTANLLVPSVLVGRQAELAKVRHILEQDGDLLLAGVPGSGRRTLIRYAAQVSNFRLIDIDCLRATDSTRFLHLIAAEIVSTFSEAAEQALIRSWCTKQALFWVPPVATDGLQWLPEADEWELFQKLISLPQTLAEWLNCRVVIVFQNFPHIRSWDRGEKWQTYLRQEIQIQDRVSYTLIATVAERWVQHSNMQVVFLGPLNNEALSDWLVSTLITEQLVFDADGRSLDLFLSYVQGNFGDAMTLARRICLETRSQLSLSARQPFVIKPEHVKQAAQALVQDLSVTFESLILLLPPSQVRVLESLALDPTPSPQSQEYIRKHRLSRGGGLQGALASLEQKGLVYGAEYGYRLTLPLLALWLRDRLG